MRTIKFLLLFFTIHTMYSQQFTENTEVQGVLYGEAIWLNVGDDSSMQQLVVNGYNTNYDTHSSSYIFQDGSFISSSINTEPLGHASLDKLDANNDGYTDLITTGINSDDSQVIYLYMNDGSGNYNAENLPFAGITTGKLRVADFDNNLFDDFIITGVSDDSYIAKLYMNNGDATFTEVNTSFFGNSFGDITIFDANSDGNQDVLLTGFSNSYQPESRLYLNDGNAIFTENTDAGITGIYFSGTSAVDYDNDGDIDILLSGFDTSYTPFTGIYDNNGDGNFTLNSSISLMPLYFGTSDFIDYNNDGQIDIFLTGTDADNNQHAILYEKQDNNYVEDTASSGIITGAYISSSDWSDFDNDGDLDFVITGLNGNSNAITKIYSNNLYNTAPTCESIDPSEETGDTSCITFNLNGETVEYTTVRAANGTIWLQQNLGSNQVAQSATDEEAFGDLYQWGRWTDGHQKRNSVVSETTPEPNNPTGLSTGIPEFYGSEPQWWANTSAEDKWEANTPDLASEYNGCDPCKILGEEWHLPTEADWESVLESEQVEDIATAYTSSLKLTVAGSRSSTGDISNAGVRGYYWSSTVSDNNQEYSKYLYYSNFIVNSSAGGLREQGFSLRCLKSAQPVDTGYCDVSVDFDVEPISLVQFADIDNATSAIVNATPAYEDFTTITGTVAQEQTYNLIVQGNTNGVFEHDIRVFIDWNADGTFDMNTEYYATSIENSTGEDGAQATLSISIPNDATIGTTRMRITKDMWNVYEDGEFDACTNAYYGQVEDYTLNITEAITTPEAPIATAATYITATGFTANWETVENATGYLLDISTSNDFNTFIEGYNSFEVTATSVSITGLNWNTTYYYRIRATNGDLTSENSNIITVTTECGIIEVPNIESEIVFCENATIADLVSINEQTQWFTVEENGTALPLTDELITGTYYTSIAQNGCESSRVAVSVIIALPIPPTGETEQEVIEGETLADLDVTGDNLVWYTNETLITVLPENTSLEEGITYYVASVVETCTSEPLAITITTVLNNNTYQIDGLKAYPNPVQETLTITNTNSIDNISIYNLLGQVIITNQYSTTEAYINMSSLTSGTYFIKVTSGNKTKTLKVIKE